MKLSSHSSDVRLVALVSLFFATAACADTIYTWSYNGNVEKFTSANNGTIIANTGDSYNGSVGLAIDSAGNLYAGNPSDSSVTKYLPNGGSSTYVSGADSVSGLAFDNNGNFYGTSPNWTAILKLSPPFPPGGIVVDGSTALLNCPQNMAFDSSGNFYVANSGVYNQGGVLVSAGGAGANTIEKFTSAGVDLGTFATSLNIPFGLALDSSGNVFVSNAGNDTIIKLSPSGTPTTFATASTGLSRPEGLAFDSAGNLYVANAGNGTIEEFTPGGSHSVYASGVGSPAAIAITNIPEPSTWSLLLAAVTFLGALRFRRHR